MPDPGDTFIVKGAAEFEKAFGPLDALASPEMAMAELVKALEEAESKVKIELAMVNTKEPPASFVETGIDNMKTLILKMEEASKEASKGGPTYQLLNEGGGPSILCCKCGYESWDPSDVKYRHCSNCGPHTAPYKPPPNLFPVEFLSSKGKPGQKWSAVSKKWEWRSVLNKLDMYDVPIGPSKHNEKKWNADERYGISTSEGLPLMQCATCHKATSHWPFIAARYCPTCEVYLLGNPTGWSPMAIHATAPLPVAAVAAVSDLDGLAWLDGIIDELPKPEVHTSACEPDRPPTRPPRPPVYTEHRGPWEELGHRLDELAGAFRSWWKGDPRP